MGGDIHPVEDFEVDHDFPNLGRRNMLLNARRFPPESSDAGRLEQVVVNLLTNAAKYTDSGGSVWLTLQQEGEEAVLRVRDTGVGIAPEVLPRIFDLFTQAERSLDRSQGGLGIGLALVQRLVEMHGGTVVASSVLWKGSEFVVRLPMVSPPEPNPSLPPIEKAKPTGPSLRVLVVDDNVDTVTTLSCWCKNPATKFGQPSMARRFWKPLSIIDRTWSCWTLACRT
jgi:anti-sigma regulatory factor (Ser/Thr protein kinase)